MPVAGVDYPRNWEQFSDWFASEEACREYLEKLRWPHGFACPRCGAIAEAFRLSRDRLKCRACRHQTTATSGTVFERTRTPIRSWFAAIWYITNQKNGVSALGLKRVLGLGSYQTAWSMLHKLRRAMVRPDREPLSGLVEVDEIFFAGGPRRGTRKGQAQPVRDPRLDAIVGIAIEIHQPRGFGRIRLRQLTDKSENSVLPFIREEIAPGATLRTDGSAAYRNVRKYSYEQDRVVHLGSDIAAHVTMPGVHRVASLLRRWLTGTLQGAVQAKQLDYYLDEFTFRFNRRSSESRGLLFYRLLEQAVVTGPTRYSEIVKHNM